MDATQSITMVIEDIYEKIIGLCKANQLSSLEDKVKEIFAWHKCCAKTAKGVVCGKAAKEAGHCGTHLKKRICKVCKYARKDGSACSLPCPTQADDYCWLHEDKATVKAPETKTTKKFTPRARKVRATKTVEEPVVPVSQPVEIVVPVEELAGLVSQPIESSVPVVNPIEPVTEPVVEPAVVEELTVTVSQPDYSIEQRLIGFKDVELREITEHTCPANGCGARLKINALTCPKHKQSLCAPILPVKMSYECKSLSLICQKDFKGTYAPSRTVGLEEEDVKGDDDNIIDEVNANPVFRTKYCIYFGDAEEKGRFLGEMCGEPVYKDSHMCKEHRKFSKSFKHNPNTNRYFDPYWEPSRPFLENARLIAPNFKWFSHLNFFAHITPKGPIVVGKSWSLVFPESLDGVDVKRDVAYSEEGEELQLAEEKLKNWLVKYGETNDPFVKEKPEDLIKRCHNNGLLYKILPQEVLHTQFDLPRELDSLDGSGFTSFEQMIVERPALYIKYWNVWLGHIRRAKEFTRFMNSHPDAIQAHLNIYEPVNWEYYLKHVGPKIGLYHVEVPAPALEQVESRTFNPFKYCSEWVKENAPDKEAEPHYPPMYLLYPFPLEYYEEKYYMENRIFVEQIRDKKLYAHYNARGGVRKSRESWMQWLKYGEHRGEFIKLYAYMCIEDIYPSSLEARCKEVEEEKLKYAIKYST